MDGYDPDKAIAVSADGGGKSELVRAVLVAQTNAEPAARQDAPSERRIGGYTRFSTDKQKQTSTERQKQRIGKYSGAHLKKQPDAFYSDIGESGASIENRPALLELLAAAEAGMYTDIVIEHYDRWSREIYDAVPIAERLEKCGVRLHSWADQRELTKRDQTEMAARAEEDRRRRTSLLSSGIDQLVEDGGIPWKHPFGYQRGAKRGYPDVCPVQSLAVKRAFELLLDHSDVETASLLKQEGYLTSAGDTRWTAAMVQKIRKNLLHIGVIAWRRTKPVKPRKGFKGNRGPQHIDDVVLGFNERYRIVSDELFNAVREAKAARFKHLPKKEWTPTGRTSLFAKVVCDCPGSEGQRFYIDGSPTRGRFRCSRDCDSRSCLSQHPAAFDFTGAEKAMLGLLAEALVTGPDEEPYRKRLQGRLVVKAAEREARRNEMKRERAEADRLAEKLLDEALGDFSSKRLKNRIKNTEARVEELDEDIARLPVIDSTEIDEHASASRLREAFDELMGRLPFRVECENDREILKIIRRLVRKVVLQRVGRIPGSVGLMMELQPEALYLSNDQLAICDVPCTIVEKEVRIRSRIGSAKSREEIEGLAASQFAALTDDQWDRVGHLLTHFGEWNGGFSTRQVADMVLFKMRTGVALKRPPAFFGERNSVINATSRFIYSGGADILMEVLGHENPAWVEDLYLGAIDGMARGIRIPVEGLRLHPRAAAERCAGTGTYRLTDEQWEVLQAELTSFGSTTQAIYGVPLRMLVDGILIKLRTGCPWTKMPDEFGGYVGLYRGAIRFRELGFWDCMKRAFELRFPEVIDGMNVAEIEGQEELLRVKNVNRRADWARIADLRTKTVSNIASVLRDALPPGLAISGNPVRVRVKDGSKDCETGADLAVTPEVRATRRSCSDPVLVIKTISQQSITKDRRHVECYRELPSVKQVLTIHSKRLMVENHVRTAAGWRTECKTAMSDSIEFAAFGCSMTLEMIYAGSNPHPPKLPRPRAKTRFVHAVAGQPLLAAQ